jgi:hypothetical protein
LLFQNIKVFYQMETEDRKTTYRFSLRGIVHEFLEKTTFLNSELEVEKKKLLGTIDLKQEWFDKDQGLAQEELTILKTKLEADLKAKTDSHNSVSLDWKERKIKIKTYLSKLEEMKSQMIKKNPKITNNTKLLKELNSLVPLLENIDSSSEIMFSLLEETGALLREEDHQAKQYISDFVTLLKDFLSLEELLKTNQNVQNDFNLTKIDLVEQELVKLKTEQDRVHGLLETTRANLKAELERIVLSLKEEILKAEGYSMYQKLLSEAKSLQAQVIQKEHEEREANEALNVSTWALRAMEYQKLRVHPEVILELQRKKLNLEKLTEMVPENFKNDLVQEQSTLQNVQKYFQNNSGRQSDVAEEYGRVTESLNIIQDLRSDEAALDRLFAMALAALQGGMQSDQNNNKCLSMLELSVYFYYFNIFQIISTKKVFYKTFMENISENYRTNVIKNLFWDIQMERLNDKEIINIYSRKLLPDGVEKSANKYVYLMNSEMDQVFQHQMVASSSENDSWYASILSCAGFTFSFVMQVLKKGALSILFTALATALLAFLAIKLPVLLIGFVSAFLAVVADLFFSWASGQIQNKPSIKDEFNKGIASIYALFSPSKIEYLDIDESLKEVSDREKMLKLQERRSEKPDSDQLLYFQRKFEKLLTFENYNRFFDRQDLNRLLEI